jgi:hypothetical protein
MRKILLALLLTLFTKPVFGDTFEFCLTDMNFCSIMRWDDQSGRLTQVLVKRSDWDTVNGIAQISVQIHEMGAYFNLVSEDFYNTQKASLNTVSETYQSVDAGLSNIPNEQWEFYGGLVACGSTTVACGGLGLATVQSMGLFAYGAVVACSAAAWSCVDALRKWELWRKAQYKAAQAEREAAANAPSSGGTGEPRPPTTTHNPIPIPLAPTVTINPGRTPSVGVSETPPGGGPPRPIRPPVVKPRT